MDLCKYPTKAALKGAADIDTSMLGSKMELTSSKTKVNNLDTDKLKTVPADSSKLSNIVYNDVIKETAYNQLVIKFYANDTEIPSNSGLVTKSRYNSDKQGLEKKIEDADKGYLILVGWSRRVTTTQTL